MTDERDIPTTDAIPPDDLELEQPVEPNVPDLPEPPRDPSVADPTDHADHREGEA